MLYVLIALVCFLASAIGAICGIGGGVIIKPVLDATGTLPVTSVSFLSGCTVLSMSIVSVYKNLRTKHVFSFDKKTATILAVGGMLGGVTGKEIYQFLLSRMAQSSRIGAAQAFLLMMITIGTLLYVLNKERIQAIQIKNKGFMLLIGMILGMMSSFLGIGGGPINVVVLLFFFSMTSKQAAMYSIYIILFSQIASLASTLIKGNVPDYEPLHLLLMIGCGILGGLAGNRLNKELENRTVDKLFLGLLVIIVGVNIYNIFRYI